MMTDRHGSVSSITSIPSSATKGSQKKFMSHLKHDEWFGKKTIGFFAGVALLINNITGPGVPSIPNMFVESGWLFPTLAFLIIWLMTSLSTTMYCEAMRNIPGNENFRDRVEYSSLVDYYFGRKAYIAAQIGINGALQSLNIISVIQSAQVMDAAISVIFGKSCGFNISPFAVAPLSNSTFNSTVLSGSTEFWSCIDVANVLAGNAWGCHIIITMGFLVCILIALPMGYFKLDDNMIIQEGAFILTILSWLVWFVACLFSKNFTNGNWKIPAVTNSKLPYASQAGVLGNILFNFGFVTTVPSWVNEKKKSVSVNKVVWLSTFLCIVIFFVMGVPPAMAFRDQLSGPATGNCMNGTGCADSLLTIFTTNDMMPSAFRNNKAAKFILQFSVYAFSISAVLSSIPVFSIVIKYNCVENGFSHKFAFFWGILFPWLIAIPLMWQPDALNQFINYSSLVFVSFTDFIVPCALYIKLQNRKKENHTQTTHSDLYQKDNSDDILDRTGLDDDCLIEEEEVNDFESEAGIVTSYTEDIIEDIHYDVETQPLINAPARRHITPSAPVHYAFPKRWKLTPRWKLGIAAVLVVVMTIAAIIGTIYQIVTTQSMQWNCAAVNGT
eukprot:m.28030 g.28030  ORF g.28030 m.28030 type:complete len:612 (-) comp9419_c0_seq1:127-1962(-)